MCCVCVFDCVCVGVCALSNFILNVPLLTCIDVCDYFQPLLMTTSVVSHLIAFPQGMVPPPPPPTSGSFPLPPKGALLPTPLFAGMYIMC